jgi:hypothetical protein
VPSGIIVIRFITVGKAVRYSVVSKQRLPKLPVADNQTRGKLVSEYLLTRHNMMFRRNSYYNDHLPGFLRYYKDDF